MTILVLETLILNCHLNGKHFCLEHFIGTLPYFDHSRFSVERNYFYIGTPNHQTTTRKAGKQFSRLMTKSLIEKSSDPKHPCRVRFFAHFLNMHRSDAQFSVVLRSLFCFLHLNNYTERKFRDQFFGFENLNEGGGGKTWTLSRIFLPHKNVIKLEQEGPNHTCPQRGYGVLLGAEGIPPSPLKFSSEYNLLIFPQSKKKIFRLG